MRKPARTETRSSKSHIQAWRRTFQLKNEHQRNESFPFFTHGRASTGQQEQHGQRVREGPTWRDVGCFAKPSAAISEPISDHVCKDIVSDGGEEGCGDSQCSEPRRSVLSRSSGHGSDRQGGERVLAPEWQSINRSRKNVHEYITDHEHRKSRAPIRCHPGQKGRWRTG